MNSITASHNGSHPPLPPSAVEQKSSTSQSFETSISPLKIEHQLSEKELREQINVFDTLIRAAARKELSGTNLAAELSKDRDSFLSHVRQVAIDQKNWKRASFINHLFLDHLSYPIILDFIKSNNINRLRRLLALNSLCISPKVVTDSQLRHCIDRFESLIKMAGNESSGKNLADIFSKARDDFLYLVRDAAFDEQNWNRVSFINHILVDTMSTPLLIECIISNNKVRLKDLLNTNVVYISPVVVAAARQHPAIYEIIKTYLQSSNHLIRAASSGLHDCVKLTLQHGAEPDMQNEAGQTALHRAASAGQPDIVRTLLDHKANPDKPDAEGDIPIINALKSKCKESIKLLVTVSNRAFLNNNPNITMELLTEEEYDDEAAQGPNLIVPHLPFIPLDITELLAPQPPQRKV